jgi:acyl CoA:acetate/3-ketoacid CoA transferase beta subunit
VVTELAVFYLKHGRVLLKKIAPEITVDELKTVTELPFEIDEPLERMIP